MRRESAHSTAGGVARIRMLRTRSRRLHQAHVAALAALGADRRASSHLAPFGRPLAGSLERRLPRSFVAAYLGLERSPSSELLPRLRSPAVLDCDSDDRPTRPRCPIAVVLTGAATSSSSCSTSRCCSSQRALRAHRLGTSGGAVDHAWRISTRCRSTSRFQTVLAAARLPAARALPLRRGALLRPARPPRPHAASAASRTATGARAAIWTCCRR